MSRSIIVELAEQAPNSIRLANGDYSVRLPEPIMIEKGDQVSLKSAFIDNVSSGSGDINVIPDEAGGSVTTVSLNFGYYAVDWGNSTKDEGASRTFKPLLPNADGSGGTATARGDAKPTGKVFILNRPINSPTTTHQKIKSFSFTWDKTTVKKGRVDGSRYIQFTFEIVEPTAITAGAFDGVNGMSFSIAVNKSGDDNGIFDSIGGPDKGSAPANRITLNAEKWRKYVDNGVIIQVNGLTEGAGMFAVGGTDNLFPIIAPNVAISAGVDGVFKAVIHDKDPRHKPKGSTVMSAFGCIGVSNNAINDFTTEAIGGDETLAVAYTQKVSFPIRSGAYTPADLAKELSDNLTNLNLESVGNPASIDNGYTFNKNPLLKTIRQIYNETGFPTAPIFYDEAGTQTFTYVTGKDQPADPADDNNFLAGTSQFAITYDNILEKIELQQIHSSIYGIDGQPQVRYFKEGDDSIVYVNKNTGVYLTSLEPESLWYEGGLKLNRNVVSKIQSTFRFEDNGGGNFIQVNFDTVHLEDGVNMTGDAIPLDGLIIKKTTAPETVPPFDLAPLFTASGNADATPAVLVNTGQTTSIIATDTIGQGKIDVNAIEKAGGYFKIEVGMPSILPEVRIGGGKTNRISSIISKFNSIGSYTSSYGEGSIPYYYNSEVPTYLSDFNIRVLEADGNLSKKLGSCSAVFLEIIKPLEQPPQPPK